MARPTVGVIVGDKKRCNGCGSFKPFVEYDLSGQTKDGFQTRCKVCRKKYSHTRVEDGSSRAALRKHRYGIDDNQIWLLLAKQDNKCPGCKKPLSEANCHVDHDHTTGKIRGLLCQGCNKTLGFAYNNPNTLVNLAQYLISESETT